MLQKCVLTTTAVTTIVVAHLKDSEPSPTQRVLDLHVASLAAAIVQY